MVRYLPKLLPKPLVPREVPSNQLGPLASTILV